MSKDPTKRACRKAIIIEVRVHLWVVELTVGKTSLQILARVNQRGAIFEALSIRSIRGISLHPRKTNRAADARVVLHVLPFGTDSRWFLGGLGGGRKSRGHGNSKCKKYVHQHMPNSLLDHFSTRIHFSISTVCCVSCVSEFADSYYYYYYNHNYYY